MTNLQNMNAWIWDSEKLMNRRYLMQENYQRYLDGDLDVVKLKKEDDPFWVRTVGLCWQMGLKFIKTMYLHPGTGGRLVYGHQQFLYSKFGLPHGL